MDRLGQPFVVMRGYHCEALSTSFFQSFFFLGPFDLGVGGKASIWWTEPSLGQL
jgi:hypothetical protein